MYFIFQWQNKSSVEGSEQEFEDFAKECNSELQVAQRELGLALNSIVRKLGQWKELSDQLPLFVSTKNLDEEAERRLRRVEEGASAHLSRLSRCVHLYRDFGAWVTMVYSEMRSFTRRCLSSMCEDLPSQTKRFVLLVNAARTDIERQIAEMERNCSKTYEDVVQIKAELSHLERAFISREKFSLKLQELRDLEGSFEEQKRSMASLEHCKNRLSELFNVCQDSVRTIDENTAKRMKDVIIDEEAHKWVSMLFSTKTTSGMHLHCLDGIGGSVDGSSSHSVASD